MACNINFCDPTESELEEMIDYIIDNKIPMKHYEIIDVSDCSSLWDTIAEFRFINEEDATFFMLKFNNRNRY